jgi:hypothetical protein
MYSDATAMTVLAGWKRKKDWRAGGRPAPLRLPIAGPVRGRNADIKNSLYAFQALNRPAFGRFLGRALTQARPLQVVARSEHREAQYKLFVADLRRVSAALRKKAA